MLQRPVETGLRYRVETTRAFRFLSVLRLEERKGWKALLRAWISAFQPADDVALVLRIMPEPGEEPDPQSALARIGGFLGELGRDPAEIPEIMLVLEPLDPRPDGRSHGAVPGVRAALAR